MINIYKEGRESLEDDPIIAEGCKHLLAWRVPHTAGRAEILPVSNVNC